MSEDNKKSKIGHPKTALDVLQGLLEKGSTPLAQEFKRYRLKLDWEAVVGKSIAARSSPVGYANGILYVWVESSSWMNQLTFARRELLKRINQYAGDKWVKDIRFTQDKRDVPQEAVVIEEASKSKSKES